MTTNKLQSSHSAYLKQHKNHPINWQLWNSEVFQNAKDQDKLIFVSLGYSSCHWCHKMADESFTDPNVGEFLNSNFISIKVDKEEFPDVDQHYQHACQVFSQTGGWPLNAFLLPNGKPFFLGTYFPLHSSQKSIGFLDLIKEIKRTFAENKETIEEQADKLEQAMNQGFERKHEQFKEGEFPGPNNILNALKEHQENEFGGYGEFPKFPQFSFYEWAMDMMGEGHIEKEYGEHAIKTLKHMVSGGVFDQLRGGIHRYSTDKLWLLPHFEKMSYDQAGFLATFTKLALFLPTPYLKRQLIQTIDYLEKEMLGDDNYFFASQDSDSEGQEGIYFCYTKEEFQDALAKTFTDEQIEQAAIRFNITDQGNYNSALNVLSHQIDKFDSSEDEIAQFNKISDVLLDDRKQRIPPQTDTKGVASWNFLLLSSLCKMIIKSPWSELSQSAETLLNKTHQAIKETFVSIDQNKFIFKHSTSLEHKTAYFEDHVFYLDFLYHFYQLRGKNETKKEILTLVEHINHSFIKEDKMYMRSIKNSMTTPLPNNEVRIFDQSFRSPAANYLNLLRTIHFLFPDKGYRSIAVKLQENVKGIVLSNPINSGEALRAFTYPWEAYFLIKTPRSFLEEELFLKIRRFAPVRMLFDYSEEKDQWQICSDKECKDSGNGLNTLAQKLGIPL